ncbi:MAG: hypothetical protein Q3979_05510 [Actinomycetaceae bacterium]|nr:hypothetical protein [Actinomycetaceae bacterium]
MTHPESIYVNKETGEITGTDSGVEFATVLLNIADGASHQELSDNLRELVEAVQDTGKSGTLTYTLKVAAADEKGEVIIVKDMIKLKKPEYERGTHTFFADKSGNLTQDPPNQTSLFERLTEA